jgi:hypothetical protein
MSVNNLSTILAMLPNLSSSELDAVIATATALKAVNKSRPKGTKPAKPAGASGKAAKGPAKQASPYEDNPQYKDFKASDRELKALLKKFSCSLKELESFISGSGAPPSLSDEKVAEEAMKVVVPVHDKFIATRNEWFRVKMSLAHDSSQAADKQGPSEEAGPAAPPSGDAA